MRLRVPRGSSRPGDDGPRDPHAAVTMLGTALGVGFPPSAPSLRPVAADFALVERGPGA